MNAPSSAPVHFPPADLMQIGAYYYPEAWPETQWARDFAGIRKLGLEFVHLGEFAWAYFEPTEGNFDFAWLDRAIGLANREGLKIILCTPSPAPPVWLTEKHPEVLMIDAAGRRQVHGTRQHATWSSPTYREYVAKIVHALGEHYGRDERIWGWQLDNELTHYGKEPDFSEASQEKFQTWLEQKYGNIAALNRDWGNQFWSQLYQRFDQVRLPSLPEYVAQFNPHQMLDSQRWFAQEAADYLRFQTKILRHYCGDRQWITTNYIQGFPAIDPSLNASDFEAMSWTIYPVHGNANEGPLGFRLGSSATLTFAADFMRSLNGAHGIMELQPGQVNWGEVNPQPYPGAVRLWLMRAFAAGAKFFCTYRYRQPLYGAELYHAGLINPDGVTPSSGGEQFAQVAREIAHLRTVAQPGAPLPLAYAARRTAILYNYDVRWDLDNHKQHKSWDSYAHLLKYHSALKRVGAPVDVITEEKDFSIYPFLIAPAYQLLDLALVQRWRAYAESGGHLILSCRTGHKDRRGFLWDGPWAAPIVELIGAQIKFYDTLPPPNVGHIEAAGQNHTWITWADILSPAPGTQTLARYTDHYYAGEVAAITRPLGRGSVTYIGADSQQGTLEAQLVRNVLTHAGVAVENFPEGFCIDFRDGLWVATNFREKTVTASLPAETQLLLGTREIPTAGVAVWKA